MSYLRVFGLIVFLVLSCLVVYKASVISVTYDEGTTIHSMNFDVYTEAKNSANTQYLNSLLAKWSGKQLGDDLFNLRLLNVLAFIFYFLGAYSISRTFLGRKFLIGLILITFIPFVLDFFSLSRGYGLSIGFILYGMSWICREQKKTYYSLIGFVFLGLAVLANLIALNLFLILTPILIGRIICSQNSTKIKWVTISMLLTYLLCVLGIVYPIINSLIERNQLFFGGRQGFFEDSIVSIGNVLAYHEGYNTVFVILAILIFITALTIALYNIVSVRFSLRDQLNLIVEWGFVLYLFLVYTQYEFLEVNLPVERTALILLTLPLLVLVKGPARFNRRYVKLVLLPISIVFFIQFNRTFNLDSTYSWKYDGANKTMLGFLSEHIKVHESGTINLGVDQLLMPSCVYNISKIPDSGITLQTYNNHWETVLRREEVNPNFYGVFYNPLSSERVQEILAELNSGRYQYVYVFEGFAQKIIESNLPFKFIRKFDTSDTYLFKVLEE